VVNFVAWWHGGTLGPRHDKESPATGATVRGPNLPGNRSAGRPGRRRNRRDVTGEHWKSKPEEQDLPAAESYLSLLVGASAAAKLVKALKKDETLVNFAAKDLLRASGLPLLSSDDPEVAADLRKIRLGSKLSPVLLVQGDPLWIADGYHRICVSYHVDEKAEVPCRMVSRAKLE